MNTVFFDSRVSDDERRARLYDGQLFVFSPTSGSVALCDHARALITEAFGVLDPELAQHHMAVEDYAELLAQLKPRFIHHPRSKECIRALLGELGCDTVMTYFDVPRLRTSTSGGYLTSGIAYAFHPHRDTWYAAPLAQLNWWIPIYEVASDNVMAFHPRYWRTPVRNGSKSYNYYQWNAESRKNAAKHVRQDTRTQPKPEEPIELESQIRLVVPVGGIVIFSGAQLHSTVPNTSGRTRFSIDFRTVHRGDLEAKKCAPNIDSECTGTSLRDFLRATDLERLPEELVLTYDDDTRFTGSELIYRGPSNPD